MPDSPSAVDERPPAPSQPSSGGSWLGFAPRTVLVVGILVFAVMVAEYVWLYSPFGSTSSSVTATDAAGDGTTDTTADNTTDSSADPGSDAVTYVALGNVTIRSSPKSTSAELGKIPKGTSVAITCVVTGDPVKGATTTDSHWDKVTYGSVTGYVSNTLMKTGAAIDDPSLIPAC